MFSSFWKATFYNTLISLLLFICLWGLLWLSESLFSSLYLLKWHDTAWCVGIPASIIGVAYVLTIRNPQNYTGFYLGIIMSVLLSLQFFIQGNYDLTILYLFIFVPFQIRSVFQWKQHQQDGNFSPCFLDLKKMLLSLLVFVFIITADWMIATYIINHDQLTDSFCIKLFSSLMISSSVLSNFWLIYRKNDAWIYWIIYSISGIAFYVIIGNVFSIVLFIFFLVINSIAGISWLKNTPKKNLGWLQGW